MPINNTITRRLLRLDKEVLACFGILMLDMILLCIAAARHTLWRDETNPWLIARDSYSLVGLMQNLRYEPHPPLWNFLLYAISRLSWNPEWMKLPNLTFAVVAVGLILFCQRLSRMTRIGITFSYFFLFEYSVIDRDYMFGVVLLIAATLLATGSGQLKSWAVPVLLSLATMSSLPALVLAVGIWGVYMSRTVVLHQRDDQSIFRRLLRADLLLGSFLVAICALVSTLLVFPPADTGAFLGMTPYPTGKIGLLVSSGKYLLKAYMPIPTLTHKFWENSYYDVLPYHLGVVADLLGWTLLLGFGVYLRRRVARAFFLTCSGILLLQYILSGHACMRHIGWLFVCLVLALLIEYANPNQCETKKPLWQRWMLSVILTTQVCGGIFALAVSLRYPFSSSLQVAGFLRSRNLDSAPLIFEPDYVGSSVIAYLQRPEAYNLEQHRMASFVLFNRDEVINQHLPNRAELNQIAEGSGAPVLITEKPLTLQQEGELRVHLLAAFDDAINSYDRYYLYR